MPRCVRIPGVFRLFLKDSTLSADLVSDTHPVHRDLFGQRVQRWSLCPPRNVARRSRALSSSHSGFSCVVRQDHAFLDGRDCIAAPDSSGSQLGLAGGSYSSTAHRNNALGRNHCFQSHRAGTDQRSGESLGSPEASSGLARTKTALGPPACSSRSHDRVSVSRADAELQGSGDKVIQERKRPEWRRLSPLPISFLRAEGCYAPRSTTTLPSVPDSTNAMAASISVQEKRCLLSSGLSLPLSTSAAASRRIMP
jgi:hypothetical protein